MADDRAMADDGSIDPSDRAPADPAQLQNIQPTMDMQPGITQPPPVPSGSGGALRMASMAAALPADQMQGYNHGQRYAMGAQGRIRHMQSYGPQAIQTQLPYTSYSPNTAHAAPPPQYSPYIDQPSMPPSPYSPLHGQYGGPSMYGTPQASPQFSSFSAGYGFPGNAQPHGYHGGGLYQTHEYAIGGGAPNHGGSAGVRQMYQPQTGVRVSPSRGPTVPSAPRGPPRKPKQSGHALWVGNLPPGTQVGDLKDHFSRDATKEIESVFLISKSNCAFVNYRTEPACTAAMSRFHDSRFQGVRLVCRLRKGPGSIPSPPGAHSPAPSGPAALQTGSTQSQSAVDAISQNRESSARATEVVGSSELPINDKYFIVKSLTVEDLELSVRNGIWATQGHNEDALNNAYHSVESVFLIFSANKSGEYFGYARMESPINDEIAKGLEWKPFEEGVRPVEAPAAAAAAADPELPRSILTPATEFAPKGRIIDDSARGTIFWEADSENDDQPLSPEVSPDPKEEETESVDGETDEQAKPTLEVDGVNNPDTDQQTFGRPFRVRWINTAKLPFYRTRGLRNPWNANREVKIARDGTELETSVGRRLISLFHRAPAVQPIHMAHMPGQQPYMGPLPEMGYGMGPMSPGRY